MIDVRMFTVGPVQENSFIVRVKGSDHGLIVDPGDEADKLLAAIDALGIKHLDAILLTHTHFDHVGAVAPVAKATGAPVYCPELETRVLANIMDYVPWPGFGPFESYDADHTVAGGETLELAGLTIDVIFTPGHSPGHVTYAPVARTRCSPATSCSRARSAASICPVVTGRRCSPRSRRWSMPIRLRRPCIPGTWGSRRSSASARATRSCASCP